MTLAHLITAWVLMDDMLLMAAHVQEAFLRLMYASVCWSGPGWECAAEGARIQA